MKFDQTMVSNHYHYQFDTVAYAFTDNLSRNSRMLLGGERHCKSKVSDPRTQRNGSARVLIQRLTISPPRVPKAAAVLQYKGDIYRIYSIKRPGRLLNFWSLRVGAFSRWALIRGWALIKFSPLSASSKFILQQNNK